MYSIRQHIRYNLWANTKLIEGIRSVEEQLLIQEAKSSFSGVAKTLLHISDAETIWLRRLQGVNLSTWPSAAFTGAKEDLFKIVLESSANIAAFVESKDDSFLEATIHYKSLKGEGFSSTADEMLQQVVNHGTYHRGQVITLLRGAGITTLPNTDLIQYLRSL